MLISEAVFSVQPLSSEGSYSGNAAAAAAAQLDPHVSHQDKDLMSNNLLQLSLKPCERCALQSKVLVKNKTNLKLCFSDSILVQRLYMVS